MPHPTQYRSFGGENSNGGNAGGRTRRMTEKRQKQQ